MLLQQISSYSTYVARGTKLNKRDYLQLKTVSAHNFAKQNQVGSHMFVICFEKEQGWKERKSKCSPEMAENILGLPGLYRPISVQDAGAHAVGMS